jgi:radical SAM protein (TIGR01212 family)
LKGMQTCVFCDVWGSAARSESATMELRAQIEKFRDVIAKRFKAKSFLVYFQAYTNTFTKISGLRENFETALSYDFVKGFVVGTRPDCISKSVLDLWQEYHQRSFVAVELGVQSFFEDQLQFMRRGHTAEASLEAIHKIAENTDVDLGIHLIFGNPGETDEQIIRTAEIVNTLPITNVKLHNLHALKNTPLEAMFHRGEFTPIDRETYSHRVKLFLQHLAPHIAMHRLAAFASRWEELVAPAWTADKMGTHQFIIDFLRHRKAFQSELFQTADPEIQTFIERLRERSLPVL